MNRKLVLFNGPPRSGKDTAADYLVETRNAYSFKFSAPVKAAIKATFDLHEEEVEYIESIKSEPTTIFNGLSYRQAQISFSEDWLKPTFGQEIFGRLAAQRLRKAIRQGPDQSLYVSSDSGFASEAYPVIKVFGPENVLLVRVFRDGCDFTGDSRSYLDLKGVSTVTLTNCASLKEYRRSVVELIDCWLANTPSPF